MSKVTFYILGDNNTEQNTHNNSLPDSVPAHFMQACIVATFYYQQNRKVFIYTDNQQDAFTVDETLWQFDGDSFVPHNLLGEGPRFGTPVEISWMPPTHPRPILINLSLHLPDFTNNFQQIIDFVPNDEQLKMATRARYSAYRKLGHTLTTENINTATLSSDSDSANKQQASDSANESSHSNNQTEDK
ncbi:DNA polymerase III subunit chi [Psychromonas sp. KJ10-10]|uniref:DNA polymerase III subunit chi n=1 Tax=Psychromonas sp. KJ10-10 TaxID=3391823 RepID=UPI0039B678D5